MAKTVAERQRDYRARRGEAGENGERRLNLWIPTGAAITLQRLATFHGVTKRQILEDLLLKEDTLVTKNMTQEQFDAYVFSGIRKSRQNSSAT